MLQRREQQPIENHPLAFLFSAQNCSEAFEEGAEEIKMSRLRLHKELVLFLLLVHSWCASVRLNAIGRRDSNGWASAFLPHHQERVMKIHSFFLDKTKQIFASAIPQQQQAQKPKVLLHVNNTLEEITVHLVRGSLVPDEDSCCSQAPMFPASRQGTFIFSRAGSIRESLSPNTFLDFDSSSRNKNSNNHAAVQIRQTHSTDSRAANRFSSFSPVPASSRNSRAQQSLPASGTVLFTPSPSTDFKENPLLSRPPRKDPEVIRMPPIIRFVTSMIKRPKKEYTHHYHYHDQMAYHKKTNGDKNNVLLVGQKSSSINKYNIVQKKNKHILLPFAVIKNLCAQCAQVFQWLVPQIICDMALSRIALKHTVKASCLVAFSHSYLYISGQRAKGEPVRPLPLLHRCLSSFLARYFHLVPHGLGINIHLDTMVRTGNAGATVGALLHYIGQEACFRLVQLYARKAPGALLRPLNGYEVNGLLLLISHLGNTLTGSRLKATGQGGVGAEGLQAVEEAAAAFQLRGFFTREEGLCAPYARRWWLSLPFDLADALLGAQGVLAATEREVVRGATPLARAFRAYCCPGEGGGGREAAAAGRVVVAHSLGTLGARTLKGMGLLGDAALRLYSPALALGWAPGQVSYCLVGDPVCGGALARAADPGAVLLPGAGHRFAQYAARAALLPGVPPSSQEG